MIVTLIRHGQTDWNLAGRIQGTTDIALNDTGRMQAREAATALVLTGPTVMYSSDLARANETARIIAAAHGLPEPIVIETLRERNYGEAEGILIADFVDRFGPWPTAIVPGAETPAEIQARAHAALRELVTHATEAGHSPATELVAVSHGAFIGELLRSVTAGARPAPGESVANGQALSFRVADTIEWLDGELATATKG